MAGRLSFSIAINLLTENFKKGTNTVKNGFRSMQAQILTFAAALGFAGVSLSNLVSEIIRVARETGKAVTALKNVSGSTAQFADNLRFTTALAKKYGAYVNDITANFAKFTAAANTAGMSMDDQRKLFESLSRASAGFGMSADETNGMFLAITQMMSKGKIQAEELRGQLGERLPIAMQAMAKAAGTTVAGLDKIMKEGKLLSAEVLPAFADALNEMLPNVDTDNIETSLNRLRNAFQSFTQTTGVQDVYKRLIDGLTSFVSYAQSRLSSLVTFVIALVSGKLLANVIGFFKQQNDMLNSAVKKHAVAETQKQLATQKRIEAEKLLEAIKTDYETIENGERLASKAQVTKAKKALETAELMEKKAALAAGTAAENAAAIQSMGLWKRTGAIIVSSAKRAALMLKAMWATAGPMVLITVVSAVISKLVEMHKEAKRIRNIFSDYKKEMGKGGSTAEVVQLNALRSIAIDINQNLDKRKAALSELNSKLNTAFTIDSKTLAINKDINAEVDKRIKLLENAAKADRYIQRQIDTEDRLNEIYSKYGGKRQFDLKVLSEREKEGSVEGKVRLAKNSYLYTGKHEMSTDLKNDIAEVEQLNKVLSDVKSNLKGVVTETVPSPISSDPSNDRKNKSPLEKAEESYAQKIRELEARREIEKMSISQYNKALDDLNKSALIEAKASGDKQILESQYYKKLQSAVTNLNYTEEQKAQEEFLTVKREYIEASQKLKNQLDNGVIDQKRYNEELASLADTTVLTAGALSGIGEAGREFITALQKTASDARAVSTPQYQERDKTFDYKKTNLERLRADRDNWQDYVDKLKGKIGGDADEIEERLKAANGNLEAIKKEYGSVAAELIEELNNAMGNVTTLGEALKIAEVKQDIKVFTKELNQGLYAVKDIASSADRLVSAFSSLSDVMNDEDATTWERILAVWNAMTNTIDAFLSIITLIENLTEITKKLGKAKQTEAAIDTAVTTTKVTNATAGASADVMAAGVKATTATKEVVANTAIGASEAGKGAAKLPFPWNIVAIGGAIAAALAAFAMIPKFATGGIVQGSTSGDNNLARVNGGEMILNGRQQATLFQIANGSGLGRGNIHVTGETYVAGDKLKIVLSNTEKKQGRGR